MRLVPRDLVTRPSSTSTLRRRVQYLGVSWQNDKTIRQTTDSVSSHPSWAGGPLPSALLRPAHQGSQRSLRSAGWTTAGRRCGRLVSRGVPDRRVETGPAGGLRRCLGVGPVGACRHPLVVAGFGWGASSSSRPAACLPSLFRNKSIVVKPCSPLSRVAAEPAQRAHVLAEVGVGHPCQEVQGVHPWRSKACGSAPATDKAASVGKSPPRNFSGSCGGGSSGVSRASSSAPRGSSPASTDRRTSLETNNGRYLLVGPPEFIGRSRLRTVLSDEERGIPVPTAASQVKGRQSDKASKASDGSPGRGPMAPTPGLGPPPRVGRSSLLPRLAHAARHRTWATARHVGIALMLCHRWLRDGQ